MSDTQAVNADVDKNDINPCRLPFPRWIAGPLESLLGLSKLAAIYDGRPRNVSADGFLDYVLKAIGIHLDEDASEPFKSALPATGSVLVVANHPLGGADGVALAKMLLAARSDVKVLTNELLTRIPELAELFIGVDVLSAGAASKNVAGLRAASAHLKQGGVLLMFPSGVVSAIDKDLNRIADPKWNRLAGAFARKYATHCLPVFVKGRNSDLFYKMGLIHPRLRTVMLPRELANKADTSLTFVVGKALASAQYKKLDNDEAITSYLRLQVESMGFEHTAVDTSSFDMPEFPVAEQAWIAAISDYKLLDKSGFSVYCVPSSKMGELMEYTGRLREITFSAVGEGTGKDIDVDQFDPYYSHLFVWDDANNCIAGGYRVGHIDTIVAEQGVEGLYSHSLFEFDESYLQKLGGAIEVGRSFVSLAYQRNPAILDLLWRGLGKYVVLNPQYHTLLGAVSISRFYSDQSRALIASTLVQSFGAEEAFKLGISPREKAPDVKQFWDPELLKSVTDVGLLNQLVQSTEKGMGLPVLMRHYLSLNGRYVCFSENKSFSDALDGMLLVDLRQTPIKYLKRYLGKAEGPEFLKQWGVE